MSVRVSDIALFLECPVPEEDFIVDSVCSLFDPKSNCLTFSSSRERNVLLPDTLHNLLILAPQGFGTAGNMVVLHVANPRLSYAITVSRFFSTRPPATVSSTAIIHSGAQVSSSASIGHHCVVEENVVIGDEVVIGHNSSVLSGTKIGPRSIVGCNTVLGSTGFGFERDRLGSPVRLPHLGGVEIGSDVEIGSNVVVARGTIADTRIEDFVKVDDTAFVAHNAIIGNGSLLVAGCEISGSVRIGRRCWIGPLATLRDGIEIGDEVTVGMGAVVTRSVLSGTTVAGNPARVLHRLAEDN